MKHLLETGAISQAEYDRQTSQCTAQQWSAAAAQAQQQRATKLLGDTRIRAPFDGIIGERYVNVGQYVAAEHAGRLGLRARPAAAAAHGSRGEPRAS